MSPIVPGCMDPGCCSGDEPTPSGGGGVALAAVGLTSQFNMAGPSFNGYPEWTRVISDELGFSDGSERLTVPVGYGGLYELDVMAWVSVTAAAGPVHFAADIEVNDNLLDQGALVHGTLVAPGGLSATVAVPTLVVALAEGDTVRIFINPTATTTTAAYVDYYGTYLTLRKITPLTP